MYYVIEFGYIRHRGFCNEFTIWRVRVDCTEGVNKIQKFINEAERTNGYGSWLDEGTDGLKVVSFSD